VCQELRPENERALKQLVGNLQTYRNSLASNVRHPLDRTQAERWMQMLDLPRYGYFRGTELLVYLIVSALRFHPPTDSF